MRLISLANLMVPVLVGIYTVNYGRWAWRQGLRFGAVMLMLLSLITVALPAYVLWLVQ